MGTLKELKEERAELIQKRDAAKGKLTDLDNKAKAESRSLTNEENTKFDALAVELRQANEDLATNAAEISRAEVRSQIAAENAVSLANPTGETRNGEDGEKAEMRKIAQEFRFAKLIAAKINNRSLEGREKEMVEEGEKEARASGMATQGYALPAVIMDKRALSAGSAASSGNTISTDLELVPHIYPDTVLTDMGVTIRTGLSANHTLVRKNGPAVATWEGETDQNAATDTTWENVPMTPHRLGATTVFSKQLDFQSEIPSVEMDIRGDINEAIGVALETAMINGSGTNPIIRGLLNSSGINVVANGANGGAPTWKKIVELKQILKRYKRGNIAFLTSHLMAGELETTKKDAGSGIFLLENERMAGYPVYQSEQVPEDVVVGTSNDCHPIIIGDWRQVYLGQWGAVDVVVNPYTLDDRAQVKVTVNTWWDMALRYPQAFAAIFGARIV